MKAAAALTFAFLISGWFFSASADELVTNTQEVVSGNTAFAIDLYGRVKGGEGNLFFSPYSISTALAMTYAGARGETAQQMANVLHFPARHEPLHAAFAALSTELNAIQKGGKVQIRVANSLWPQEKYPFLPEYLGLLKKYYDTSVTPLDYVNASDAARKTINDWVEQKTNRKITDLIKPGMLNALTRLVLANAVYFKGKWAQQFDPKETAEQPFHLATGKDVECQMMVHHGRYGYAAGHHLQMLELPYVGRDLSMVVLLPNEPDWFGVLEDKLTAANLAQWMNALQETEAVVFLPKFTLTRDFNLKQTLAAMGMTDAFSEGADFSGMDGRTNWLYISEVVHKAFVNVNEEGTEAAAATGGWVVAKHSPEIFRADHPFIFLIRDRDTGSILFLGRVTDVTARGLS